MMDDDGETVWWVEKKVRLGGEQEKGMRVLAETCRPPRHAAKRPFFFFFTSPSPPNRRNLYRARLPLYNVEPAGLALTTPIEMPLYTCAPAFYPSETLCLRNLRVGESAQSRA